MKDFKKRSGRGRQYMRMAMGLAAAGVLALAAVWSARAAFGMYQKFAEASAADAAAQSERAATEARYAAAKDAVAALESGRGLEAAVRERYGVGRPGEGEIDIVRQASSSSAAEAQGPSLLERLWRALFAW